MSQSQPPARPPAAWPAVSPCRHRTRTWRRCAALVAKLTYAVGKDPVVATERDWFVATALRVRDRIVDRWMTATRAAYTESRKRVYYLSLEFLIGRLLIDALNNLRCWSRCAPRWPSSASISTGCARSSPTRRWAMAASAGSPPASWKAWRRWRSPPTATASATTTACSAR